MTSPAPIAPPSSLLEEVEDGISHAYAGDEELTTGITGAGVDLASKVSGAVGGFFDSVSVTLAQNPDIVTYAVYVGVAYSAYVAYLKFFGKKKS